MDKTRFAAIPTMYKGVRFRSRLEAKWGAMFDLMGWPWKYEPFDAEGYIPDFLIDDYYQWIVEIKPLDIHYCLDDDSRQKWMSVLGKISASGIVNNVAILGNGPSRWEMIAPHNDFRRTNGVLGYFTCYEEYKKRHHPELVPITPHYCANCRSINFSFDCTINGCHRDPGTCGKVVPFAHLNMLWKNASNLVQWKGQELCATS